VQTLLGHSSIATTERYTAVDNEEIRAAMMAAGWLDEREQPRNSPTLVSPPPQVNRLQP
jgi:site-specific recombinase XerC